MKTALAVETEQNGWHPRAADWMLGQVGTWRCGGHYDDARWGGCRSRRR
jgi:hypothetical protein